MGGEPSAPAERLRGGHQPEGVEPASPLPAWGQCAVEPGAGAALPRSVVRLGIHNWGTDPSAGEYASARHGRDRAVFAALRALWGILCRASYGSALSRTLRGALQ